MESIGMGNHNHHHHRVPIIVVIELFQSMLASINQFYKRLVVIITINTFSLCCLKKKLGVLAWWSTNKFFLPFFSFFVFLLVIIIIIIIYLFLHTEPMIWTSVFSISNIFILFLLSDSQSSFLFCQQLPCVPIES